MSTNELSRDQFHSTFREPMRRLGPDEVYRPVDIAEYVAECIQAHRLPTSLEAIEVEHVALSGDKKFTHIVFMYGERDKRLIVIVGHDVQQVYGHYFLDLAAEYGSSRASA